MNKSVLSSPTSNTPLHETSQSGIVTILTALAKVYKKKESLLLILVSERTLLENTGAYSYEGHENIANAP